MDVSAPTDDRTAPAAWDAASGEPDPQRWITLGIVIIAVVLIAVDISVLNVSIPTILRDLDTTVPALQWVITGYSLTFASLLIIGGQLGDVYGHRRLFLIGVTLFGIGSLIASLAQSVGVLILGEAVIEGMGASLMLPSTLAILSTTFQGRERATAFAAWGATTGAAVAFGPVLGGFLTTNYSWRWSFRINVVVAPVAVLGALLFMRKGAKATRRPDLDLPGAAMIASGMFLLVFSLSQGSVYGWFEPIKAFHLGPWLLWPTTRPLSITVLTLVAAGVILASFVVVERAMERRGTHPLFEFGLLQHRSFRYGLLTVVILAMGQLTVLFALPLFLQESEHLSAQENGLWLLPLGLAVIVGAQIGGRLTRRISPTAVARLGLLCESAGSILVVLSIRPGLSFASLLPGLVVFGVGIGLASSQLTNVILSEIPVAKSGVASGANSTARQIGSALGGAVIGSLIAVRTTSHAVAALRADRILSPAVRDRAIGGVRADGPSFSPAEGTSKLDVARLDSILSHALSDATRTALLMGTAVVFVGALLSFLMPRGEPLRASESQAETQAEAFESIDPIDNVPGAVLD
ncbi:MFS transporter [Aquihabitans sp. G128]|uniref:MFS transporter n=1 Tax=Aquihabitans sp. G128 TaxID=2849779 RepID=UPI001C21C5E6|nr:MFS transporter [Aquihabitans sp. G128]QXC59146.1 MFS transporter [Aquihabitans sp. G128]